MSCSSEAKKITVVIPHYNRFELLKETLRSLTSQTVKDWEVIIVDDQSAPDEYARVRSLASDSIQVLQRTDGIKGPSRCRNLGWRACSTPFVLFLDSDDLLAPWCIEQRLQAVTQTPDADAWLFRVMLFRTQPGDLNRLWNEQESGDVAMRFLTSDPPWHTASTLWSRETLESLGGFNESIMYGDDADLHLRAVFRNVRFQSEASRLPDCFIRRADIQRITNSATAEMLKSRLTRLREGTLVVRSFGRKLHRTPWCAQYFVECEHVLFVHPENQTYLAEVIAAWKSDWPEAGRQRMLCIAYIRFALLFRKRAYLLLRCARAFTRLFLPTQYFPSSHSFESSGLPDHEYQQVLRTLANAEVRPPQ